MGWVGPVQDLGILYPQSEPCMELNLGHWNCMDLKLGPAWISNWALHGSQSGQCGPFMDCNLVLMGPATGSKDCPHGPHETSYIPSRPYLGTEKGPLHGDPFGGRMTTTVIERPGRSTPNVGTPKYTLILRSVHGI